ncbi:MAG: helix-turn-helix transcriptional regulator [Syntrophomonadaceae bacterium]|nr:helix-turn-helix transcriptional regulator [Syntrophomonadaceae bacterium]
MDCSLKINNKFIGYRIRQEREKLDLSREAFAEIIGLSDYYVGQLERAERQMSLSALIRICSCLHVSADYLLYGNARDHADTVQETASPSYSVKSAKTAEIISLLEKCTAKELELITKIIRTIIPYLGSN